MQPVAAYPLKKSANGRYLVDSKGAPFLLVVLPLALEADDGSTVTLESLRGKNVVLFFYPKDNTSG